MGKGWIILNLPNLKELNDYSSWHGGLLESSIKNIYMLLSQKGSGNDENIIKFHNKNTHTVGLLSET